MINFSVFNLVSKWKGVAAKPLSPRIKYDVFVSFRGKDIRQGLLSHLIQAFPQKQIHAFVDNKLERGDEIQASLLGAIEESSISLIIFSEDYASSHWCLEELEQIVKCQEKYGQTVIPIFYHVDPTVVRYQKGTYENALARHEKLYKSTRVKIWRHALNKSANLSGIKSSDFQDDAELLEEIVKRVDLELIRLGTNQVNSRGLVGIDKPIEHLVSLLHQETKDVRVIGIWGMGGIGKTTIAEEVFNSVSSEYDGCFFLANVREESGRYGIVSLKEKLFSTLLSEDVKISTPNGLSSYIKRRIGRKKVLIVLDDVNDSGQIQNIIGTHDWLGSGSRIILTTRDKQLLIANKVDDIYKVDELSYNDALKFFCWNSFNQSHLEKEYYELSKRVLDYAKGIPLVLKVLGHLLCGKDKEVWESQLDKLRKMPIKKIHDIMRLSYYDLDREEKNIFLDLACFFNGLDFKVDYLKCLLKYSENDNSAVVVLERLKDKALITISENKVVFMHDIIREMAWEIIHQESSEEAGSRRLGDPHDIYEVLTNDKGTEAIRSIRIHLSVISELKLSPHVFNKMNNLHYLDIHGDLYPYCLGFLPQGLQCLPTKLRYLRWLNYPLKSLPENISAEKLVILDLTHSRLEKLWDGVQNLANLKEVILYCSTFLKELPNFSKATNLEVLDISTCSKLTSVHPSVFFLKRLRHLDLSSCDSITKLKSDTNFSSLDDLKLTLRKCKKLREFSATSKNMIELYLEYTSINALPASFKYQSKLEVLSLAHSHIGSLPRCFENFTRLRLLSVSCCSKLQTLPELPSSLEVLFASDCTSLKTILFPSKTSEQFKGTNKTVEFWNCLKLDEESLIAVGLNAEINVMKFASQHLSALENNGTESYYDYNDKYYSYQTKYVYPGSSLPDWLVYKTVEDYIIIDLSSAPPFPLLGFIFCFVVVGDERPFYGRRLQFNICVIDDDNVDEGSNVEILTEMLSKSIEFDHVCVMYDQRCSCYLTRRAKNQSKFKIKATVWLKYQYDCPGVDCQRRVALKGFGIKPISISANHNFNQQMELCDTCYIPMSFNKGIWKWIWIALSIALCIFLPWFTMKFLI